MYRKEERPAFAKIAAKATGTTAEQGNSTTVNAKAKAKIAPMTRKIEEGLLSRFCNFGKNLEESFSPGPDSQVKLFFLCFKNCLAK